jgi:hypothetical protein
MPGTTTLEVGVDLRQQVGVHLPPGLHELIEKLSAGGWQERVAEVEASSSAIGAHLGQDRCDIDEMQGRRRFLTDSGDVSELWEGDGEASVSLALRELGDGEEHRLTFVIGASDGVEDDLRVEAKETAS